MQKYYKYQYRFNATHSFDYKKEHQHQHTFTITIYVSKEQQTEQIMFFDIDKIVTQYLNQYEHCVLNDIPAFQTLVPNMENIGDVFFEDLKTSLYEIGVNLYQLDIYTTPLSIYQVSSRIHLPASYRDTTDLSQVQDE